VDQFGAWKICGFRKNLVGDKINVPTPTTQGGHMPYSNRLLNLMTEVTCSDLKRNWSFLKQRTISYDGIVCTNGCTYPIMTGKNF